MNRLNPLHLIMILILLAVVLFCILTVPGGTL
jgi:hypothetical protein